MRRPQAPRAFAGQALPFLVLLVFWSGAAGAAELSPRLQAALSDPSAEAHTVWVFFRDKGLAGPPLLAALERQEARLNSRAARRRAKMKAAGESLAGQHDLPLHGPYLDAAQGTGATLRRQSRWLNAASFRATSAQVRRLAALDFVARLDLVAHTGRVPVPVDSVPDRAPDKSTAGRWSLDYGGNLAAMEQFNVPAVHELGIDGQGVVIGFLDSGFHTGHECLENLTVLAAYDFVNDDAEVDTEDGDPEDSHDHGTMTMSTAMGYMPGSHVAPAFAAAAILCKTEDVSQEVPREEDNWVAGLEFAESHGADIISSSLSYKDWYTYEDMDGQTAVTTIAADLAVSLGLVVVNSAGNQGGSEWYHITAPADGDGVIAVGAVNSDGVLATFSSRGPTYDGRIKPDVSALGSNNHVADPADDGVYRNASGTSFSCPLTSGVAALVLSRAPQLTPLQVREALRQTASRADNPDNGFGWGLIDALAAVNYFVPQLEHTPLTDTEDLTGPYTIAATITCRSGIDPATALVRYRLNGGGWQGTPLIATGGGPASYVSQIPGQPDGTVVDYYLEVSSPDGIHTALPFKASQDFFSFRVGQDVTPPVLTHSPLRDQALIRWPVAVNCLANDNLDIQRVELTYSHGGGPLQGPFLLAEAGTAGYQLVFPLPVEEVAIGDTISYTLTAFDTAAQPNQTADGPHSFAIIDTRGALLVLERTPLVVTDEKVDLSRKSRPVLVPQPGKSSATTLAGWLQADGYVAEVLPAESVTVADFSGYQAVIYASGDHLDPLGVPSLRQALRDWVALGGKLLVEGGEVGYDATQGETHPDFLAEVLHCTSCWGDNGGDLVLGVGMAHHPLLNKPDPIALPVVVDYDAYGDEDTMLPAADAYPVLVTEFHQDHGGIIVYDDTQSPQSAQIVYMTFDIEAVEAQVGRALARNAVAYLLAPETPPTAGLSGRVRLAGQMDSSGILVELSDGRSVVTGADGTFSFSEIYAGYTSVVATREGWSAARYEIDLNDGQQASDVDLLLQPMVHTEYRVYPGLTITDNNATGVISTLTVPESESGAMADVSVDIYIQHDWIADLTVMLISPAGTMVVLHNRSCPSCMNLNGNWPETRTVDGPGSLDDLLGADNAGVWTLFVSDGESPDEGTLVMWGLQFDVPDGVSGVAEDNLPQVTRLNQAVPNPFNPRTTIGFDLARSQAVRLDIYDLRGRLVRRLVDEPMPAGKHTAVWDGRDERGRNAASGTYLYRLRAGEEVHRRKMQLVR